jgi:hypothetical protein
MIGKEDEDKRFFQNFTKEGIIWENPLTLFDYYFALFDTKL